MRKGEKRENLNTRLACVSRFVSKKTENLLHLAQYKAV